MLSVNRLKLPPCNCFLSSFGSKRTFQSTNISLISYKFTSLKLTRSILNLNGIDSVKFLQGLITNDIKKINDKGEKLLFAAMLKADGRMLHDVFISSADSPIPQSPTSFYIDHSTEDTTSLRSYLKRHILRSKVKLGKSTPLEAENERVVYTAWKTKGSKEGTKEEIEEGEKWFEENRIGRDIRNDEMGWRWSTTLINPLLPPSTSFIEVPPSEHHLHRLLLAIPENPIDWPNLPLEGNLDYMNGVDYKKGCYVGQELTARTHHRGVVRKRGVVLRLFREGELIPTSLLPPNETASPASQPPSNPLPSSQSTLTRLVTSTKNTRSTKAPRPSGKLGSSLSALTSSGSRIALGFGSVRLEHIDLEGEDENSGVFIVTEPVLEENGEEGEEGKKVVVEKVKEVVGQDGRWLAKAFIPEWIQEKIKEEDSRKADE